MKKISHFLFGETGQDLKIDFTKQYFLQVFNWTHYRFEVLPVELKEKFVNHYN